MMPITIDLDDGSVLPCLVITITRVDGTVERITTAQYDVVIGSDTWTAHPGLKPGVLSQRNDGTPPTMGMDVTLLPTGHLKFRDLDRGKYERAEVLVQLTDAANPVSVDFIASMMMLGSIDYDIEGNAKFDLISKFSVPRDILVSVFTLQCSYSFGDPLTCRVPTFAYSLGRDMQDVERSENIATGDRRRFRFAAGDTPEDYANVYLECTSGGTTDASAPSISSTVGASSSDGSVTWITRNAWVRAARITAVDGTRTITLDRQPDPRGDGNNDWFHPLRLRFYDGEYAGRSFKGGNWDSTNRTIQVYLPCPYAAVNDWVEIAPTCDQTYAMCRDIFENTLNHGGYPFQLGAKYQSQQLTLT